MNRSLEQGILNMVLLQNQIIGIQHMISQGLFELSNLKYYYSNFNTS